jgi:hypothetical protein
MRFALCLPFLLGALLLAGGAAAQDRNRADGDAVRGVRIDAWPPPSPGAERPQMRYAGAAAPPASPALKNKVGLAFHLAPSAQLSLGAKMSFRVRSDKAGYIVIVDVDANGKTTQVYPNALSSAVLGGQSAASNKIDAGASIVIPPANSKTYEFVASPPAGVGMAMAIFSPAPLQIINLPDVPATLLGRPNEAKFLSQAAQSLRFIPTGASDDFKAPDLSFAVQFYVIR